MQFPLCCPSAGVVVVEEEVMRRHIRTVCDDGTQSQVCNRREKENMRRVKASEKNVRKLMHSVRVCLPIHSFIVMKFRIRMKNKT